MALFEPALMIVIKHEGGFVSDPTDMGGATNFGISARLLSAYLKKPVSVDQMKQMTLDQAAHIYRSVFWDALNLTSIQSQELATVVFDLSVLFGVPFAATTLQEIMNVTIDGVIGSHTVGAVNKYLNPVWLGVHMIEEAQLKMVSIAVQKPEQLKFLSGWLARTHDLLNVLYNAKTLKGEPYV